MSNDEQPNQQVGIQSNSDGNIDIEQSHVNIAGRDVHIHMPSSSPRVTFPQLIPLLVALILVVGVSQLLLAVAWLPTKYIFVVGWAGLGFSGLLINLRWIQKVVKDGRTRQDEALEQLRRRIRDRVDEPRLLTPNAIRSLALSIEAKTKCAVITDKLIIEVIRTVALDLENDFKGDDLIQRVESLNTLLKGIDAAATPLLSLATVDVLSAYKAAQPFVMAILFVGVLITSILTFFIQPFSLLSSTLLVMEAVLLLSSVRAHLFWKDSSNDSRGLSRVEQWFVQRLRPLYPGPIFDTFLLASLSRQEWTYSFWHNIVGPLWEEPIMQKYTFNPEKFAIMHEFRYDIAKKLAKELRKVQRDIDIARMNDLPAEETLTQHFKSLCRKLWVITGDEHFREAERRGELTRSSLSDSIMRFL